VSQLVELSRSKERDPHVLLSTTTSVSRPSVRIWCAGRASAWSNASGATGSGRPLSLLIRLWSRS
jgi:hypothetical protein